MKGGDLGGVHGVVDPGGWRQVLEELIPHHVAELLLEKAMDPVDGEVAVGAEHMEAAGKDELVILLWR